MRFLFFLSGFLFCTAAFGQGNTTADYYQYQRDQQFKKYMETTGSAGMSGSIKTSDWSVDKNALKEMADMWDRRAGRKTPEELERERAERRKKEALIEKQSWENSAKRSKELIEAKSRKAWADQLTMGYVKLFLKDGFHHSEAYIMAVNWVREKQINNKWDIVDEYHERSDRAAIAYKTFLQKEKTAGFEELMALVADFDMAGYTAVKILEKLAKRFPQKQKQINALMPFHGMTFWENLGYQGSTYQTIETSAFAMADSVMKVEMNHYLRNWMKEFPASVSLLKGQPKDELKAFKILVDFLVKQNDRELLRLLLLNTALYEPELVKTINKAMDWPHHHIRGLLGWDDLEAIRKHHNISGYETVKRVSRFKIFDFPSSQFTDVSPDWNPDLYADELKRYGEAGDAEALNTYAVLTLKGMTKDKKDDAYAMMKKSLEGGCMHPISTLKEPKVYRKLGIDHWGLYLREIEWKHNPPQVVSNLSKNKSIAEQKLKIETPGKPLKTVYYYGDIRNGMANGRGTGLTPENIYYYGEWKDNIWHGKGELIDLSSGRTLYVGLFFNGKKFGPNNFVDNNGHYENDLFTSDKKYKELQFTMPVTMALTNYKGQVENGMANGFGKADVGYLGTYEGFWKDNTFEGIGILSHPTVGYYGEFKDGKPHGWGVRKFENGVTYTGDWKEEEMTGKGVLSGKLELEGEFVNGMLHFQNSPKRGSTTPVTASFKNWKEAVENYDWVALEVPVNDQNIMRYLKDGQLHFTTFKGNYTWGVTPLHGKEVSDYTYEAIYHTYKIEVPKCELGLVVEINDNPSGAKTKLLFMADPTTGNFYFGTYSFINNQWTNYADSKVNGGWFFSAAINRNKDKGEVTNKLAIKKSGSVINLYANGQLLFTQKIAAPATAHLQKFGGVGIVQGPGAEGYISAISFKSE
ncbi:MORN repeat-containing protein [Sediminibacterium sp. C3]|uniref:MORN repeat-containing protein n=1 Tax=Sediminibacterium sp. C3 TaxID=1267211 RepID=UPI0003F9CBB8|nr:hypothetical protein [Sediminibacterium sp. C3]